MHLYLQALLVTLCCVYSANGYDFLVNADLGTSVSNSPSISWRVPLSTSGGGNCAKTGVLKISFGAPNTPSRKEKVLIDMWFNNPTGWTFNIGDSRTNNGYGGDASTTSRDAEVHSFGRHMLIYGNDYTTPKKGALIRRINNVIGSRLQIIISNGLIIWNNLGMEFNYELNANLLFALNGQSDPGKTKNYDIYFGINRTVGSAGRRGRGLCRAEITWLS